MCTPVSVDVLKDRFLKFGSDWQDRKIPEQLRMKGYNGTSSLKIRGEKYLFMLNQGRGPHFGCVVEFISGQNECKSMIKWELKSTLLTKLEVVFIIIFQFGLMVSFEKAFQNVLFDFLMTGLLLGPFAGAIFFFRKKKLRSHYTILLNFLCSNQEEK